MIGMSDLDYLKDLLKNLGIENKLDLVLKKSNVFGPTTKFFEDKLIWLDLSNLGIEELPEQIFDHLTNLQELKLFKNEISSLPRGIFDNLTELTELHLKDNKITQITRTQFTQQGKLQRLFLMGNPLPNNQAQNFITGLDVRNFLNQLPE